MFKVLPDTNDIQRPTTKPILNVQYTSNPNKNIKSQPCFSQILGKRFSFVSSIRHMTFDYYIKQRLPMCEFILNQLLH